MSYVLSALLMILNKAALIGVTTILVWILQGLMVHPEVVTRHPFLGNKFLRFGLAAMAGAFAIDFFSSYTPSPSELILNLGLLAVLVGIWRSYKKGQLVNKKPL